MDYGFHCWVCGKYYMTNAPTPEEAEIEAGKAGWTIGHHDGQGEIGCPGHEAFDALPLGYCYENFPV